MSDENHEQGRVPTVAVVTTARADWGIFRPVAEEIGDTSGLELEIYASGMHLTPEHGRTVEMIEADGFDVDERVEMLLSSDSERGVAKSLGIGTEAFADVLARRDPDMLLVLGDRYEILAPVTAALPQRIPVAHVHGGELSRGAIDDAVRHAVTMLSHLHFVSTKRYRRRVCQMGEQPDRVFVTGAPGLDNLRKTDLLDVAAFRREIAEPIGRNFLLVTYHPVTLDSDAGRGGLESMLEALADRNEPLLFTRPNADAGGCDILEKLREFVGQQDEAYLVDNLGTQVYFSAMHHAKAMVGNSSSGVIEAPSFELPVVNVGPRQGGRVRGENIVEATGEETSIADAIERATSEEFRADLRGLENPYGDGHASERIATILEEVFEPTSEIGTNLTEKVFYDIDCDLEKD